MKQRNFHGHEQNKNNCHVTVHRHTSDGTVLSTWRERERERERGGREGGKE
jgi:hypothetical protein